MQNTKTRIFFHRIERFGSLPIWIRNMDTYYIIWVPACPNRCPRFLYVGTWRCWQEFTMRSKFKGKYLEIEPIGKSSSTFNN